MTSKEEFIYNFESFNDSYVGNDSKLPLKTKVGLALHEILKKVIIVKEDKEVEIRVDVLFDAATNERTKGEVAFFVRILTDLILTEADDNGVYTLLCKVFHFFLNGLGAIVDENTKPERVLLVQYLTWLSDPKSGNESPKLCEWGQVNGLSTEYVMDPGLGFIHVKTTYPKRFAIPWYLSPYCLYFLIYTKDNETKLLFEATVKKAKATYGIK